MMAFPGSPRPPSLILLVYEFHHFLVRKGLSSSKLEAQHVDKMLGPQRLLGLRRVSLRITHQGHRS